MLKNKCRIVSLKWEGVHKVFVSAETNQFHLKNLETWVAICQDLENKS